MLIKNVCKGLVKKPIVSLICVLLLTAAMLMFQLATAMTGVTTAPRVEKHLTIAVPAQSLFNEGLSEMVVTVCRGESAKAVAAAVMGMGMNRFAADVPVMLVISEESYNVTAAMGAKVKGNDYRSIDIGILAAYITAEACAQGLSTCILGWLDDKKIREICNIDKPVRLVITLGYAAEDDKLREKKRKESSKLVKFI